MRESRQYLPFLQKSLPVDLAPARMQEFNSGPLRDLAIHPLREINHAHATAADYTHQPKGAAARARRIHT